MIHSVLVRLAFTRPFLTLTLEKTKSFHDLGIFFVMELSEHPKQCFVLGLG